jgi:hypothetical protein
MVIREVTGQDSTQVVFAKDNNVVAALAADGTDQALGQRILLGAVRRWEHFVDAQRRRCAPYSWSRSRRRYAGAGRCGNGGDDLRRAPDSGVTSDVAVDDALAMVGQHYQDEQDAQAGGREEPKEVEQQRDHGAEIGFGSARRSTLGSLVGVLANDRGPRN